MSSSTPSANGFRSLEAALVRRRLRAVDAILRIEMLALATLSAGFVFWQVRIPLDSLVRKDGPLVVVVTVGIAWLALSGLAALLAGARMLHDLRHGPEGPPWLALPIEPAAITRHLAWNARARALPLIVPAAGVLLAGAGLAPWWWLLLLAAALALIVTPATRIGCWVAVQLASRATPEPRSLHPIIRLLARREPQRQRGALPPARWRGGSALFALWRKDLLVSLRPTRARRLAVVPVLFIALAASAWALPVDLALARFVALGLSLVAATTLAEWLVALSGTDPFSLIRVLPVGLKEVWGARVLWALLGTLVLVLVHALAAREMPPVAYRLFLVWTGGAVFSIALLGANYGVTLFPRADVAARMLLLSLGLAMAASLMIPLLGWVLLLTAVLHSARRLPRWSRLEDL